MISVRLSVGNGLQRTMAATVLTTLMELAESEALQREIDLDWSTMSVEPEVIEFKNFADEKVVHAVVLVLSVGPTPEED